MRPHCLPAALSGSRPRSNGAAPEVTSGALAGGPWASVLGRGQQERAGPGLLFGAQWPTQQDRGPLSPGNLPHSRPPFLQEKGGDCPGRPGVLSEMYHQGPRFPGRWQPSVPLTLRLFINLKTKVRASQPFAVLWTAFPLGSGQG